jgi:hypothetical protein
MDWKEECDFQTLNGSASYPDRIRNCVLVKESLGCDLLESF